MKDATPADREMRRRDLLRLTAAVGLGAMSPRLVRAALAGASTAPAAAPLRMVRFPEKTDLILLTDRPPNLETPIKYFRHDLTPNDAFFVRWHLSGIPTEVNTRTFRLSVGGHVDRPTELSLDQLKNDFEPASLVAVAQCSGNSRSFYQPRVGGGQWGHGAVGNAKWTGVRLRDLLSRAGVKAGAIDVTFAGLDRGIMPDVPQFIKSLTIDRANDGEVIVAYAMNDAPLPMLNGFPLRLVVPGWYATYWVKALNQITVLSEKYQGFWMKTAYRIPNNAEANESPQQLATDTVPISVHSIRSLIVTPDAGGRVTRGKATEIEGVAFDAGHGIRKVQVSTDGGATWRDAKLDAELGKYSWRRWRLPWTPQAAGRVSIMAKATNAAGQTQGTQQWNRSGYQRNVIEHVDVNIV